MKHRRILIVDDDEDMRALLFEIFQQAGYNVELATDGQQALESIERSIPNVILSDFNMPVMDGCELARTLQNRHIRTPFVMMTSAPEVVMSQKDIGSATCLSKPFDIRCLLSIVNGIVP